MRQITREKILKKYDYQCVQCGAVERLEVDHIIPLSIGGRDDEDNLQILCRTCNAKKHNKNIYHGIIKIDQNYKNYILVNQERGLQIMASGEKNYDMFLKHLVEVIEHTKKYLPVYGIMEEGSYEMV